MKYFNHDVKSHNNKKLRKVTRTHGGLGYGVWWMLLELLYSQDNEEEPFLIHADELWLEDTAERLHISDHRTLIRIFDTFAEVELINAQLWADHILFCDAIKERADAYMQIKIKNAQRKREQREREKAEKLDPSLVSQNVTRDTHRTFCDNANVTPPDPDPYSDPKPKINIENTNTFTDVNKSAKSDFFEVDFREISDPENQTPEPLTQIINQEPLPVLALVKSRPKNGFTQEQFNEYWAAVGKKVDRKSAIEQFFKIRDVDFEVVLKAVWDQQAFYIKRDKSVKFMPQPKTWLKNRRWEDEIHNCDTAEFKSAVEGSEILNLIQSNKRRNANVG